MLINSASVSTFRSCFHVITLILTIIYILSYYLTVQLYSDAQLIWSRFFVAPCFSISWVCHMLFLHVNWKHMLLCCITFIFTSSGNSRPAICEYISSSLQSVRIVLLHCGFVELWQLGFSCMWSLGFFPR